MRPASSTKREKYMIGQPLKGALEDCVQRSASREDLWTGLLNSFRLKVVAEIGVWKGDLAAHLLERCDCIQRYYMIDPWRHLDEWNKPANVDQDKFDAIFEQAMQKTSFASEKVTILRGRTTDVIHQMEDLSLDFLYIDGDHTLRGITVDLISAFSKVKPGGFVVGDDFCSTIWQHAEVFEPTLVFPFAVYFAEATRSHIYALPYNQFLLQKAKASDQSYEFTDLTGRYGDTTLLAQLTGKRKRRRRQVDRLRTVRSDFKKLFR